MLLSSSRYGPWLSLDDLLDKLLFLAVSGDGTCQRLISNEMPTARLQIGHLSQISYLLIDDSQALGALS
jgi:hypothetical protein